MEEEQKCAISSINSHCWEHSPQSVSSMSSSVAQQEEKRHMVCLLCGFQSVERRDTKFDFSTYDEFEAKRDDTTIDDDRWYKLTLYDVLFWFITSYTV